MRAWIAHHYFTIVWVLAFATAIGLSATDVSGYWSGLCIGLAVGFYSGAQVERQYRAALAQASATLLAMGELLHRHDPAFPKAPPEVMRAVRDALDQEGS